MAKETISLNSQEQRRAIARNQAVSASAPRGESM